MSSQFILLQINNILSSSIINVYLQKLQWRDHKSNPARLYPQKFKNMKNGHLNPFLQEQSPKKKNGPDSITNYFIFIKIKKLSDGSKTSDIQLKNYLIGQINALKHSKQDRNLVFLGLVPEKQVHLHIVNSMCSSLVYLVNTLWVPS